MRPASQADCLSVEMGAAPIRVAVWAGGVLGCTSAWHAGGSGFESRPVHKVDRKPAPVGPGNWMLSRTMGSPTGWHCASHARMLGFNSPRVHWVAAPLSSGSDPRRPRGLRLWAVAEGSNFDLQSRERGALPRVSTMPLCRWVALALGMGEVRVRFPAGAPFGGRLMVGHRPLTPGMWVRSLPPELVHR